jgi:hypothetical protein
LIIVLLGLFTIAFFHITTITMSDDEYYEDDDDWYWYEDEYTGIGVSRYLPVYVNYFSYESLCRTT